MGMQTDVKSAQLDVTDSINYRTRLKGVLITCLATGVVEIKNGSSSGNAVFGFNAKAAGNVYVPIPGEGVLCEDGIYMNRSDDASVTVFYG
jgi:hypothetical protein